MSKNLSTKQIENVEVKYGSDVQLLTDWVDTTNFVAVAGRGTAKSTIIIARRSFRCVELMPGAPLAIVADTYTNLVNNIMPAVQNGWRIRGLIEGVHYVKGVRPPESWRQKCSVIVLDYKNVYSFYNGSVLFLGSLDSPSLLAGKSVAHLFFDEAKYAADARAARVMPILRGDAITYGRCYLYGGVTITTDMPDVTEGEYDWFFRYAAEMDPERIIKIVQTAAILNNYMIKLLRANSAQHPDTAKISRLEKKVARYESALHKLRKGQTFFANLSSFANVDILTLDYARRLLSGGLELHEFLKSVLGMRPGVKKSARFYVMFDEIHKYTDGTISGEAAFHSGEIRRLDPTRPLDGGLDFGNMNSFVIAQPDGKYYRIHKNLYVIPPESLRELADQFITFFSAHENKTLYLFYDRAGNNGQRTGEDKAGQIKDFIERDAAGNRTGWTVILMSRKQGIIHQDSEYNFMLEFMGEKNPALPLLRVDALNCSEMISSIEGARQEVRYRGTVKVVAKVKKSEKLEAKKLPRLSTNFSDAFKYLMMRRTWINAIKPKATTASSADAMADQWAARHLTNHPPGDL